MKSFGRGGRKKFSIGEGSGGGEFDVGGLCSVFQAVCIVDNSRLYVDQQQEESRAMPRRYS